MKPKKKRCTACRLWFTPDPRVAHRSFFYCPAAACRQTAKEQAQVRWLAKNSDYYKGETRKAKVRLWAKDYPDYWQTWRRDNEDYVERNRHKQKLRDQKRRFLAKQDQIAQNPLGEIEGIRLLAQKNLAKQDQIRLPIEGILDYLAAREFLAKQELMVPAALSGP